MKCQKEEFVNHKAGWDSTNFMNEFKFYFRWQNGIVKYLYLQDFRSMCRLIYGIFLNLASDFSLKIAWNSDILRSFFD